MKTTEKEWITKSGLTAKIIIIDKTKDMTEKQLSMFSGDTLSILKWRCGYVKVDENNKNYRLSYDDLGDICVHGGVTFSDFMGEDYWFGFDCAHANDSFEVQTLEYCINECENLANQLADKKGYLK